ncbi:unnamed protein product [Camellia sinensis]
MASSTALLHYSPGLKIRRIGHLSSHSSSSSSSSCSSSSDNRQGFCCNFSGPSDWIYVEAELKRRLGRNFLIYASSCNSYTKTFAGIDGAGKRLADEIMQIVKRTESLKRISFLAHSLGGVFARYAIAVLYSPAAFDGDQSNDLPASTNANLKTACSSRQGMIARLEPVNFITLASPHLGVRGKKQLPFLLGVPILEKLAPSFAPIFVGRTGSQLFLTDGKPNNPPLLLRMASDCEDGKFICHLVGWRTSSIRREAQLFKSQPPRQSLDGYKHVVDVEYCPPISSEGPHFPPEAAKAKEAAQNAPNTENTNEYHEIMEVDVKNEWFHNAGAGVVAHVADSIKQQEMQQKDSKLFIVASLYCSFDKRNLKSCINNDREGRYRQDGP